MEGREVQGPPPTNNGRRLQALQAVYERTEMPCPRSRKAKNIAIVNRIHYTLKKNYENLQTSRVTSSLPMWMWDRIQNYKVYLKKSTFGFYRNVHYICALLTYTKFVPVNGLPHLHRKCSSVAENYSWGKVSVWILHNMRTLLPQKCQFEPEKKPRLFLEILLSSIIHSKNVISLICFAGRCRITSEN